MWMWNGELLLERSCHCELEKCRSLHQLSSLTYQSFANTAVEARQGRLGQKKQARLIVRGCVDPQPGLESQHVTCGSQPDLLASTAQHNPSIVPLE